MNHRRTTSALFVGGGTIALVLSLGFFFQMTVLPLHRLSLILCTAVLLYSGGLAAYYLLINKSTRPWRIQP